MRQVRFVHREADLLRRIGQNSGRVDDAAVVLSVLRGQEEESV